MKLFVRTKPCAFCNKVRRLLHLPLLPETPPAPPQEKKDVAAPPQERKP
jgi:hypothetical protein